MHTLRKLLISCFSPRFSYFFQYFAVLSLLSLSLSLFLCFSHPLSFTVPLSLCSFFTFSLSPLHTHRANWATWSILYCILAKVDQEIIFTKCFFHFLLIFHRLMWWNKSGFKLIKATRRNERQGALVGAFSLGYICITAWKPSASLSAFYRVMKCSFPFQYPTRGRIEMESADHGASTIMKHLMESISISLEPAHTSWRRTATQLRLSTRCG